MFDSLFGWLLDLLAKVWNLLKKVLPYVLLAAAAFVALGGAIPLSLLITGLGTLEGAAAAIGLAGASFLFAPGESAEVISEAAGAVGDAASSVVAAGVDVADGLVSGLLTSSSFLMIAGLGLLFLFMKKEKKEETGAAPSVKSDEQTNQPEVDYGGY